MLTFHKISYKNLLSVGDIPIELNLDTHATTLITAPNGSGKSILAEAITFVLFDKSYRGMNKSELVNSVNQKGCLVEIEFTQRGARYKVSRGIKPNIFTIEKDGQPLSQAATTRDQQKVLETNILGFNYKSFCQTCILGTANYDPFMQLSAGLRREVSETLLDINIFSTMNKILKARVAKWKSDYDSIANRIDKIAHEISVQEDYISRLKQNSSDEVDSLKVELNAAKQRAMELAQKRTDLESSKSSMDMINSAALSSCIDEIRLVSNNISVNKSDISRLSKEVNFLNEHSDCPTCEQVIDENIKATRLETLSKDIKHNDFCTTVLGDRLNILNATKADLTAKIAKVESIDRELASITSSIAAVTETAKGIMAKIKAASEKSSSDTTADVEKLAVLKGRLAEINEQKETLMNDKPINDMAVKLLKDDGIKASIVDKFVPLLNEKVNQYLDILNFNIEFELDKNFNESIKSRYRNEFTYKHFSMGERQRLDLALLFAWRTVSQVKNSVNCNLLLLDEVFDASIDEQGTNDLIAILRKACVDNNVFVISHRGTMEERLKTTVRFTKVNGFTKRVD